MCNGTNEHIYALSKEIHETAVEKGWWDKEKDLSNISVAVKVLLIISELSEGVEALRGNRWEGSIGTGSFSEELADAIIRILDLCFASGIDISWYINEKMKYNKNRPFRHGNKEF